MSVKIPIFQCPACGLDVEGRADYIARSIKCPACGVGFIPVERKTRWRGSAGKGPDWLKVVVIGLLILIGVPLSIFMFGMLGPVIGLLIVILIVLWAILAKLGKR